VEQPQKFELIVNAKSAHALGLTIPSSLLTRADLIIQWTPGNPQRCSMSSRSPNSAVEQPAGSHPVAAAAHRSV